MEGISNFGSSMDGNCGADNSIDLAPFLIFPAMTLSPAPADAAPAPIALTSTAPAAIFLASNCEKRVIKTAIIDQIF